MRDAVAALDPSARPAIVLIDGRSGSGKSTLAAMLAERLPGGAEVVALDDIYPGWDGLADGADRARSEVIAPIRAGRAARWRRWDWARSAPGDEVVTPADRTLIVEGAGVLTAESAPLAAVSVWLESPEPQRRARALGRDGDAYRPYWERWAAQETRHLADDDPLAHAHIVVDVP